jgi:hypothetical protein
MSKVNKTGKPAKAEALDSATKTSAEVALVETSNQTPAPLTLAEKQKLAKCEVIIGKGIKGFLEVADALLEVRDQNLYRVEFNTFQDYCGLKWGFTARHANRLILAGECVANLKSDQLVLSEPAAIPENEAQARPLVRLEPAQQVKAAQIVAKKPGKHTTKDYEEAAEEVTGKKHKSDKAPTLDDEYEERPRVRAYDPRDAANDKSPAVKGSARMDDAAGLARLLELVDAAQTQARKTEGCSDVVKMLGDVAKIVTTKLNGGGK